MQAERTQFASAPQPARTLERVDGGSVCCTHVCCYTSVSGAFTVVQPLFQTLFWRPGGVRDQISRLHFERVTGLGGIKHATGHVTLLEVDPEVFAAKQDVAAGKPLSAEMASRRYSQRKFGKPLILRFGALWIAVFHGIRRISKRFSRFIAEDMCGSRCVPLSSLRGP